MKVVIDSDEKGFKLEEKVKEHLEDGDYGVLDVAPELAGDFVKSSLKVTHKVLDHDIKKAIMLDGYGIGSTMASGKVKGMVTADVSGERTGHMAVIRDGAKALAIGSGIIGERLTKSIVDYYLRIECVGGRHQVRLDMLEKMI